jgi:hypothetical protein
MRHGRLAGPCPMSPQKPTQIGLRSQRRDGSIGNCGMGQMRGRARTHSGLTNCSRPRRARWPDRAKARMGRGASRKGARRAPDGEGWLLVTTVTEGSGPGRAGEEGWKQARRRAWEAAGGRWAGRGGEQPGQDSGPGRCEQSGGAVGVRPKSEKIESFRKHRVGN